MNADKLNDKLGGIFKLYAKWGHKSFLFTLICAVWLIWRVSSKPSRIGYPCSQFAIGQIALFYGMASAPALTLLHNCVSFIRKRDYMKVARIVLITAIVFGCYTIYQNYQDTQMRIRGSGTVPVSSSAVSPVWMTSELDPTGGYAFEYPDTVSPDRAVVSFSYDPLIGYGTSAPPYDPASNTAYDFVWETVERLNLGSHESPLDDLINPGDTVLIKPNWVEFGPGVYTRPEVIRPLIDMAYAAGAAQIYVGDGSANVDLGEEVMSSGNYTAMGTALAAGGVPVQVVNLNKRDYGWHWVNLSSNSSFAGSNITQAQLGTGWEQLFEHDYYFATDNYSVSPGGNVTGWYAVNDIVLDSDVIINVPKLKTHQEMIATGSIKNLVGFTLCSTFDDEWYGQRIPHHHYPREDNYFLNDIFWRSILDMNKIVLYTDENGVMQPTQQRKYLNVVDGIQAMERSQHHVYGDGIPYNRHVVLAGVDPVAVDAVGTRVMGYDYQEVASIANASSDIIHPIGTNDPGDIVIIGDNIASEIDHVFLFCEDWIDDAGSLGLTDFTPPNIVTVERSDSAINATITDGLAAYIVYESGGTKYIEKMDNTGDDYSATIAGTFTDFQVIAQDEYFNTVQTDVPTHTLTMAVSGNGSVMPAVGSHVYTEGSIIDITAVPDDNWTFVNWTGDVGTVADVNAASTNITMNGDYAVTANFIQSTFTLTMAISGNGTITPAVGMYACDFGEVVYITAVPEPGWPFVNWTSSSVGHGIEALRPDGPGSETSIDYQYPSSGAHWDKVDDVIPDDDSTYIQNKNGAEWTWQQDLFSTQDHSAGNGNILGVTVYIRNKLNASQTKACIRTHDMNYDSGEIGYGSPWSTKHYTWSNNPYTGNAWTWQEIDDLEIGVALRGSTAGPDWAHCTQVYAEVEYDDTTCVIADEYAASTNVTIYGDVTVTANFDRPVLTMSVSGNGTTIPAAGSHEYDVGTVVDISAIPDPGWEFDSWTGDTGTVADVNSVDTTITMDDDYSITANFTRTGYVLSMAVNGLGTITPVPGSHICDIDEVVDITAVPEPGWEFVNWTGEVSTVADVNSASTNITMYGDYSITANFEEIHVMLTMAVDGCGTVVPSAGEHSVPVGSMVSVNATPSSGWEFTHWIGDVDDINMASTNVTMDSDKVVTACFSPTPTAEMIVFTSLRDGNYEIYRMNADGACQTRLTETPWPDYWPDLSPDSTRIAYVSSNASGHSGIYVMNSDGSGRTRLTFDSVYDVYPAWSPDGSKIAFTSAPQDGGNHIFTMNADGSDLTRLTFTGEYNFQPCWSPDGSKIAFYSLAEDQPNVFTAEVFIMNADGSGRTRLTYGAPAAVSPAWSPDGGKIAFESHGTPPVEIEVIEIDGSNRVTLSTGAYPSWSPDGTRIVFSDGPGNDDIFIMNADGSNRVRLTDNPGEDWDPSISRWFINPNLLSISASGNGTTTPPVGSHWHEAGTLIDITAVPDPGWEFVNWTGDVGTVADVNSASTNITMNGDYAVTANFIHPVITCTRDLPVNVAPGTTFTVTVSFTSPADVFNSIVFHDQALAGWPVSVNKTGCTPPAMTEKIIGIEGMEYSWLGPYDQFTTFTAVYEVTVPGGTPESTYNLPDGWLVYYIGQDEYQVAVTFESEIHVSKWSISGIAREANCDVLPGATVNIYLNSIFQTGTTSDVNGEYELAVSGPGTYTVTVSKAGYRDETQLIEIFEQQLLYELNFTGDRSMIPDEVDGSYFAACMNRYLYGTGDCALGGLKFAGIMNAYLYGIP